jgi:hypothetical protein
MTLVETASLINAQLTKVDIPDELAAEAVAEYNRIGLWLCDEGSTLVQYDPHLYPQGSFRLGTPVHPIDPTREFDIDLVCRLDINKENTSQKDLKKIVGDRIRLDKKGKGKLDERRRCWTLSYKEKFHLDVLPTIPDREKGGSGVLLTDKELVRWQFSNPIGYADWFYGRMKTILSEERELLAKSYQVEIEEVPEWRVRTPLQRAVQYLKRHREIRFIGRQDLEPVSIIITTLAAKAYNGERDVATAINRIASDMPRFVEKRDGKWWIPNPAHAGENFADKWNERPELAEAFNRWVEDLRKDVSLVLNAATRRDQQSLVEQQLGTSAVSVPSIQAASSPDVDDLSHIRPPPWPIRLTNSCSVKGTVLSRGRSIGSIAWFVKKRLSLHFEATTDASQPYDVKWQVTNTGVEARKANAVRGDFYDGHGPNGRFREESTLYTGTHFVEAFVLKNGVVIARSGLIPVRISR